MRIVRTKADLDRIISGSVNDQTVVAGTYRLYRQLRENGVQAIRPEDAFENTSKSYNLNAIWQSVAAVQQFLDFDSLSAHERAILTAELIKYAFVQAANDIEQLTHFPDTINSDISAFAISETRAPYNIRVAGHRIFREATFDFCSSSGKSAISGKKNYTLSIHRDSLFGLKNWFVNSLRYRCGGNRFRIDSSTNSISHSGGLITNDILAGFVAQVANAMQAFHNSRNSLNSFLEKHQELPEVALFNHIKDPITAGFASSLIDKGVKCEMASHGAMVSHGQGAREELSRGLAECVYNYFPGMSVLKPRSPLQLPFSLNGSKVVKKVRLNGVLSTSGNDQFVILYAPNFLPWYNCYHGLTASCFEVRECAEALASSMRKLDRVSLLIRVKTTVKDIANPSDADERRGLLPDDLSDLYAPHEQIHDVSVGSHKKLLEQADLVVTEGVTAVMFEALEHRKPLLLLNQSKDRIPSLPAWTYNQLRNNKGRNAVYSCSTEESLSDMLNEIRLRHENKPLSDEELSPYIWT